MLALGWYDFIDLMDRGSHRLEKELISKFLLFSTVLKYVFL
jgi:hypothetical protein